MTRSKVLFATASLLIAGTSHAQFLTPNVTNVAGPTTVQSGNLQFTNFGLVGAGRISALARDARNETLGSISSMTIDPTTWAYNSQTGELSGTLLTLPDRGYNDPGNGVFSDYVGRVQRFDMTFTPYAGPNLPQVKASQNQIGLTYTGLTTLIDERGIPTTGEDPAAGTRLAFGLPVPDAANGKMSLDAEGLVLMPDGSYYVSDEYASSIYHFNAAGQLTGLISPPGALLPVTAGNVNFNSTAAPTTGRRNNQGMEGLSITPDGKYLLAVNQSGSLQDLTNDGNQDNRKLTRVLVYDIQGNPTPASPIEHYVLELPTFDSNGDGSALDRTAAQSEVLALSKDQFLVLSRDGIGLGVAGSAPIVYKSILLADTTGATNLAGTAYEGITSVVTAGQLNPSITPVSTVEALNMLNPTQLALVGMNLDYAGPGTLTAMSEKQEGLALVPALDTPATDDYYLFIGNDNDFLTTNGNMLDGNGIDNNYNAGLDNDSVILAYHVRIAVVPEPTSLAMLGILAGAGLIRRRR